MPLTWENTCPRWDSNRPPPLENPPLPRKPPQSGPVRPRYGRIRSPGCAHCAHPGNPENAPRSAQRNDCALRTQETNESISDPEDRARRRSDSVNICFRLAAEHRNSGTGPTTTTKRRHHKICQYRGVPEILEMSLRDSQVRLSCHHW
jgi:hypothetical protein